MATYPDYPDNRLIVGGVDLSIRFQMALMDGYTLEPPEPKTYTVDIPGGDGVIDLTESLMGDTAYSNRKQEFVFCIIDMANEKSFEERKTMVSNFLHGKAFDYKMTMDPEYTYHGRFTVSTYEHSALSSGILGSIKINVDAQPYKLRKKKTYFLNATGGVMFHLPSGRKKVHPIIETKAPVLVRVGNREVHVGIGTFQLNPILFHEGINDIYINSKALYSTTWGEIGNGGTYAKLWSDLSKTRWNDIQRYNIPDSSRPQKWSQLSYTRWSEFSNTRWNVLDFRVLDDPNTDVYLSYDWKDL